MSLYDINGNEIASSDSVVVEDNKDYQYYGDTDCIYPYSNAKEIKLVANGVATATVSGITVADMENIGDITYANIEPVEVEKGYKYRVTTLADTNNKYRVIGKASNLVVGATYRICCKWEGVSGRHIQILCKKSLNTYSYNYNSKYKVYTITFEATSDSHDFYVYPFHTTDGTVSEVGEEMTIEDVYINRVYDDYDLYTHEECHYEEVSFESETEINGFNKMIIESDAVCGVYINPYSSKVQTVNDIYPDISGNVEVPKTPLHGKICVTMGDSITHKGWYEGTDYATKIAKNTGLTVYNFGFGGCKMAIRDNVNWDAFSMVQLADAIANNDWTLQETASSNTSFEIYSYAAEKTEWAKAFDWSSVEYITIAYGANDISTDAAVSVIDNADNLYDTTTYLGAFRYAVEKIWSAYPHIKFLVLTPIFRYWGGENLDSDEKMFAGEQYHYYEWGNRLIDVCKEKYHIPCLDLYTVMGINKFNRLQYFDESDGVHPNDNGITLMGDVISSGLHMHY